MDIKIHFNLDNDYFQYATERRVCDLLADVCRQILAGETYANIRDGNGNTVGEWGFSDNGSKGGER